MKVSVILAHPDATSFNHAIASMAVDALRRNRHIVAFHDLYKENFDPLLQSPEISVGAQLPADIKLHCDELTEADGIVIIHPNWWGQPPAILKGWIDRVIRPKVAYEFQEGDAGEGVPRGLLKAKTAVVFHTSNTSPEREKNEFGDPLEALWKKCIFSLCGVQNVHRRMFGIMVTSTQRQREEWIEEASAMINACFPPKR